MSTDNERLVKQARLARQACNAALGVLAGRLAHQIRNPLAAIRAACSGLQGELENPDHQETLELTLREVDRILVWVRSTLQSTDSRTENSQLTDLVGESNSVVEIVNSTHAGCIRRFRVDDEPLRCRIPRVSFRVAIFSLLEHILNTHDSPRISTRIDPSPTCVSLEFAVAGSGKERRVTEDAHTAATMESTGSVGMLVAERFARDIGGRLIHTLAGENQQIYTLEIPRS